MKLTKYEQLLDEKDHFLNLFFDLVIMVDGVIS
jgi:hypothetical protein